MPLLHRPTIAPIALILLAACLSLTAADSQAPLSQFRTRIFGCHAENLAAFEAFAKRAKQSGATHIVLTAEDLPWAYWQLDTPDDPYPAWAMSNVGLLKVVPPAALKQYFPEEYSQTVASILRPRCQVLRKLGLKAAFTSFEPQILPERVYDDHPKWRGPQVDHPLRSRVPRFAPNIDNPEVLDLYRESIRNFATMCPELEILSLHTNDSGSGINWSGGLYQGPNGSALTRDRKMYQRYHDFFAALQNGAKDARPGPLEIDAEWVRENMPELIATRLGPGMAIANFEGPGGTPYKANVGFLLDYFYPFYPALGIPLAVRYLEELEQASASKAPRLFYLTGDRFHSDLYFQIYDAFKAAPTQGEVSRLQLLRKIAASQVGESGAAALVDAWTAIHRVQRDVDLLNYGGTIFYIGGVHQRWLTRPFVPYPEELLASETDYFRSFQFQARTEERARDLGDIQGTRQYQGLGGMAVSNTLLVRMAGDLERARTAIRSLPKSPAMDLLDLRLRVFRALIENARNGFEYQYLLDLTKNGQLKRPVEFQEDLTDITQWRMIKDVARREVDNTLLLIDLLTSPAPPAPVLDLAHPPAKENIRVLGPNLVDQLRRKVKIMMAHWEDYERLFDDEAGMTPTPAR
jgi:hypothetical protein